MTGASQVYPATLGGTSAGFRDTRWPGGPIAMRRRPMSPYPNGTPDPSQGPDPTKRDDAASAGSGGAPGMVAGSGGR